MRFLKKIVHGGVLRDSNSVVGLLIAALVVEIFWCKGEEEVVMFLTVTMFHSYRVKPQVA